MSQFALSQDVFQRSYGGAGSEYGRAVIECSTGGYLIVGSTNSFENPSSDVYLLRVDELGDYIWGKNIGAANKIDWGIDLAEDSNGNFIIAGYSDDSPSGSYDGLLIKTNSNGGVIWKKTFGGDDWDFIESMVLTDTDEIILAGQKTVDGISKGWIFKTDNDGELIWERLINSSSSLKLTGIDICEDEAIVFNGYSNNSLLETKTFVAGMLNQEGEVVWTSAYPEFGKIETGRCVCSANFFVSVAIKYESSTYTRLTLTSIDLNDGSLFWIRSLLNSETNIGLSVDINPLGNIIVAGGIKDVIGTDFSAISFEFNSLGQDISPEYAVLQGSEGLDIFYDLTPTLDGGYICVGHSNSFGNNFQVLLSRIGPNGERDLSNTDFLDLTTFLSPPIQEADINLYPNPAENFIKIQFDNPKKMAYSISTAAGKMVQNGFCNTSGESTLDISTLKAGLYFISFSEKSEVQFFSRFIKLP